MKVDNKKIFFESAPLPYLLRAWMTAPHVI